MRFRNLLKMAVLRLSHLTDFSYIDEVYDERKGCLSKRWILMIPGSGCQWAKEKKGGCYMCGFRHQLDHLKGKKEKQSKFMIRLAYHLGRYFADVGNEKPGLMLIYNGGSYFNNDEVPLIMQKWIFEKVVNKYPSIRNILVESRPEFIKAEKLEEMKSIMGRKCSLSVAIGLECQSDEIRKHSINKGFSKHDYNRAVELLKGFGVHVMTYVFLKPLMLTEREAIREAIATIKYAFAHKSDSVALQAAFIQEGTVMCRFYKDGKFSLPWLWSIIAVVKKCANLGPIHIGSFHDEPSPIAVPYNCSNCNDRGMELIAVYNKTHDVSVFDGLSCKCRKLWEKEVKKATPPRSGRLLSVL